VTKLNRVLGGKNLKNVWLGQLLIFKFSKLTSEAVASFLNKISTLTGTQGMTQCIRVIVQIQSHCVGQIVYLSRANTVSLKISLLNLPAMLKIHFFIKTKVFVAN
jgi:hypothetical protein